jgi:hypothetical protein
MRLSQSSNNISEVYHSHLLCESVKRIRIVLG